MDRENGGGEGLLEFEGKSEMEVFDGDFGFKKKALIGSSLRDTRKFPCDTYRKEYRGFI